MQTTFFILNFIYTFTHAYSETLLNTLRYRDNFRTQKLSNEGGIILLKKSVPTQGSNSSMSGDISVTSCINVPL